MVRPVAWGRADQGPARRSPRVLRGGRASRRGGRARARDPRPARLRSQADRPQRPRGPRPGGQGGGLRRGGDRGARGRRRRPVGPRGRAGGLRQRRTPGTHGPGRDLPARHEGAPGGETVRRPRADDRADRPRRSRGGRRYHRTGPDRDDPGPERRRGALGPGARPREPLVPHADDAVGRRDQRDRRGAPRTVPLDPGTAARGHLLRDPEPPGRDQGGRAPLRRRARDRLGQLVELQPPRRGRPRPRHPGVPGRRRDRGRPGVDRRAPRWSA